MRALILEDIPQVRRGLASLVAGVFPGIEIVEAEDLGGARRILAEDVELDIALVDLGLPDGSGVELLRELRISHPTAKAVVTTIYDDDEHLFAAIAAGATGYLLKDQPSALLADHLLRLEQGLPALSPSIARRILEHFRQNVAAPAERHEMPALTNRQTEVLSLLARGLRRSEVAELLGISENTVARFIKDIYRRLDISSRAEAAIEASRRGLL